MTLLRDIQNSAVRDDESVTVLLRKCKILSARLSHVQLGQWIDLELNGYPMDAELPTYRFIKNVESKGNFVGATRWATSLPIPSQVIPKSLRDQYVTHSLRSGIAYYEDLVKSLSTDKEATNGLFCAPWPADMVAHVGDKIIDYMTCTGAWQVLSRGTFVSVIDTVRNRVLDFALEIESKSPNAGEASPGQPPIDSNVVDIAFHTFILKEESNG